MVYDNNEGPIYSVLNGKCSGQVQWVWEEVCGSGGWNYYSGSCEGPGCIPPYPFFDGVNDGDFTTTVCS
jgi:hypothetical protein